MTPLRRRLGVIILAVTVVLSLVLKSRSVPQGEQAAFLRYTTGFVLVKIAGVREQDGIYRFSDGVTLDDVKKMTSARAPLQCAPQQSGALRLKNGDVVAFRNQSGNCSEIIVKNMTVTESMLLGIPLDPDALSAGDWEALPGIGPALAVAIARDRQKYGEFGDLEGVLRVPGIGYGKLRGLRKFFKVGN